MRSNRTIAVQHRPVAGHKVGCYLEVLASLVTAVAVARAAWWLRVA